ncbi:hypothetical protein BD779DRAFT_1440840 [Infundibulicybe gibba]|nr:hypothetical protein BD779DRAFT_1440840 [Infundibulicybe gibba]
MPSLEYPLTRPFPGRWFAILSYIGAAVVVCILVSINTALTGYEVVTVFRADYNFTQPHWYDKWVPSPTLKKGGQCDSHVFNIGDAFTTNYTLFQWSVETIVKANAGNSGIAYTGSTLEDCDIAALYLNGDIRTWTLDVTALVECDVTNEFKVTARTAFSLTSLPGKHAPLLGLTHIVNATQYAPESSKAIALDMMMNLAAMEVADRMSTSLAINGNTKPIAISLDAVFPNRCPASVGVDAPCAKSKPEYNIENAAIIFPNSAIEVYDAAFPVDNNTNPQVITDDSKLPVENLIQTLHAALRIDLGNPNPNNIFLHPQDATKLVMASTFPKSSGMNSTASRVYLSGIMPSFPSIFPDKHLSDFIPMNLTGPASVQVVYLCRYQQRKPLPQATISVVVATLSMFSGGWAVFMLVATYIVKRRYKHGSCP